MSFLSGLFGGGGGSQSVTGTTTPQWPSGFQPLANTVGANANTVVNQPWVTSGIPGVQGFTPTQLQGQRRSVGIANDPRFGRQFGEAADATRGAMDPSAMAHITQMLQQPVNTRGYTNPLMRPVNVQPFNTASVTNTMNPFIDTALSSALDRTGTLQGRDTQALRARLAGKKAFGSGGDLALAQQADDQARQKQDMISNMLSQGYGQAAGIFQQGQGLNLQGRQIQNAGVGAAGNLDLQGRQVQNTGLGQAGYLTGQEQGIGMQGGMNLASLAERARNGDIQAAGILNAVGGQQQGQGQKNLDYAQGQFGQQRDWLKGQTGWGSNVLRSSPTGQVTTQADPSMAGQALGAGLGAYSLYKGLGGAETIAGMLGFAGGGAVGGDDAETMLTALTPWQQTEVMGLPEPVRTQRIRMYYQAGQQTGATPPVGMAAAPPPVPQGIGIPGFEGVPPPGGPPGGPPPVPPPVSQPPILNATQNAPGQWSVPPTAAPDAAPPMQDSIPPVPDAPSPDPAAPPMSPDLEGQRGQAASGLPDPVKVGTAMATGTPQEKSVYQNFIEQLMASREPDKDRWLAIAQGAAAMASSRSPRFLGALGEGIGAAATGLQRAKAADQGVLEKASQIAERADLGEARKGLYGAQSRLADAKAANPMGAAKASELERIAATIKRENPALSDTEALAQAAATRSNEASKQYRQAIMLSAQGDTKSTDAAFKMETAVGKYLEQHMIFNPTPQQTEAAKTAVMADIQQYRQAMQPAGSAGPAATPPPVAPPAAPSPASTNVSRETPKAAATAAPVGATPPQPPTVPKGSVYSPSRKIWKDPSGKFYDETGKPVAG